MRCYNCRQPTITNRLLNVNEEEFDKVGEYYGLYRINGPDDCFMPDDGSEYASMVIICETCFEEAINDA